MIQTDRKRYLLWLLLIMAVATRSPWPSKVVLFSGALIAYCCLGVILLSPSQRWRALPAAVLVGILAMPRPWSAVAPWPIMWQILLGLTAVTLLLAMINLVASHYAGDERQTAPQRWP